MNKIIICNLEHKNKTLYGLLTEDGLEQICIEPIHKELGERSNKESIESLPVGTIAVARVNKVVPGLKAAFVTIDNSKQEYFLPMNQLKVSQVLIKCQNKANFEAEKNQLLSAVLKGNDELVVEVIAQAQKMKQPIVEAQLSFKGSYCIVRTGASLLHISSKIPKKFKSELKDNSQLKLYEEQLELTVRTEVNNLLEQGNLTPLYDEIEGFISQLHQIEALFQTRKAGHIFKTGLSSGMLAMQDMLPRDVEEILVDSESIYQQLIDGSMHLLDKPVRFYGDSYPLYKLYSIESTLEQLLDKKVWLKSGGFLMIEPTEALTVIDVNSGKNSKGKDLPFETNMEAIDSITYQMRARNLTGMIVIDFINMKQPEQEVLLIEKMRKALQKDYVKSTVVDITKLGLMEITREKRYRTLREQMR